MTDKPRILLLTPAAPDFPYAGGEVLRNIVRHLPPETVDWAYLTKGSFELADNIRVAQAFPGRSVWWRLSNSLALFLYRSEVEARRQAKEIAAWCDKLTPEILWVHAEYEAASVALFLKERLDIPLHLTFYDAPKVVARMFAHYSPLAVPLYLRRVGELINRADSLDSVSAELVEHVKALAGCRTTPRTLVFPPSVSERVVADLPDASPFQSGSSIRRIGFCGSLRVSAPQWTAFLHILRGLPFLFELVVFSDKEYFQQTPMPENVSLLMQGYAARESDVMRHFVENGVHACYLGLWKEEGMRLFCNTSLSSKLATYAAAGLPVIYDGPLDSVSWRLIGKYGAGVLCSADKEQSGGELRRLFENPSEWERLRKGSRRMWECEFGLTRNVDRFRRFLCETKSGGR